MTSTAMSLLDIYWKLLEVAGEPALPLDEPQEAHIILLTEDQRLAGTSGCNRIIGSYHLSRDELRFSSLGTTRMMCSEELMRQESAMTMALEATSAYRIMGLSLELLDGDRMVARFEARDFPTG